MATRRNRRAAAAAHAADEPPKQNEEYCYNIHGHAFKHPLQHRDGITILNARGESTKNYTAVLKSASSTSSGEPESRVALELSERETASEPDIGLYRFLLVGWIPRNLDYDKIGKKALGVDIKTPPGTNIPKPENIITYDDKQLPLMVVVKILEEKPEKTFSYALLKWSKDVCTPYAAPQEHIFYLPQFRDNTSARKNRGRAWNQLIHNHSVRSSDKQELEKRVRYQRAQDLSKLVFSPAVSLKNEISMKIACYEKSNDEVFLQDLEDLIMEVDRDVTFSPVDNDHLHTFVVPDTTFGIEEAEGMLQEISLMWKDIETSPRQILLLKKGMSKENVIVEYNLIKPFLMVAIHNMNAAKMTGDDTEMVNDDTTLAESRVEENIATVGRIAKASMKTVERIMGWQESPLAITAADEHRVLSSIKRKLKEIVHPDSVFARMSNDAAGDAALEVNYQTIWETYAGAIDTDAARMAFMEIARILETAFRQKRGKLVSMIQDIVADLDAAKISD